MKLRWHHKSKAVQKLCGTTGKGSAKQLSGAAGEGSAKNKAIFPHLVRPGLELAGERPLGSVDTCAGKAVNGCVDTCARNGTEKVVGRRRKGVLSVITEVQPGPVDVVGDTLEAGREPRWVDRHSAVVEPACTAGDKARGSWRHVFRPGAGSQSESTRKGTGSWYASAEPAALRGLAGSVLATNAVETQGKRQRSCLMREGGVSRPQRQSVCQVKAVIYPVAVCKAKAVIYPAGVQGKVIYPVAVSSSRRPACQQSSMLR